ncbi:hypothetical protein CYMTET_29893 [Cymbomonas tetramitiformis]|uniref:Uncharacterized protein n=1 Tax=Cymbomonas tetramitiformis TaxID=36881 RepID=A0AAE0FLG6_9CHLO|nr:hypothetical protein CYMTET_29893 [Cymbomonas tetramitiformis]
MFACYGMGYQTRHTNKSSRSAPDAAQCLEAIQAELEALVQIKQALLMMKEEDVPPGYKWLDMPLVLDVVLGVKLHKHRQLHKRKACICAKGNKQEYGWPDIMAAVSTLSRFCTTHGAEHFVALKQVVWYLKGTLDYEMVMRTASVPGGLCSGTVTLLICIYTDAGYAGCKNTRKSTSGIAMFLCDSLVIFSSMMQRCVSLSTTEAEIIAMSEGAREIKYIRNVLDNIIVNIHKPIGRQIEVSRLQIHSSSAPMQ